MLPNIFNKELSEIMQNNRMSKSPPRFKIAGKGYHTMNRYQQLMPDSFEEQTKEAKLDHDIDTNLQTSPVSPQRTNNKMTLKSNFDTDPRDKLFDTDTREKKCTEITFCP